MLIYCIAYWWVKETALHLRNIPYVIYMFSMIINWFMEKFAVDYQMLS